jgi:hypothetical protein
VTNYCILGLQAFVQGLTSEDADQDKRSNRHNRLYWICNLDHWDEGVPPPPKDLDPLAGYKFPLDTVLPFPVTRSLEPTMSSAINAYVEKKLPIEPIKDALAKDKRIYVLGCYARHFEDNPQLFNYENYERIPFAPPHKVGREKRFNVYRPQFYWGQRKTGEVDFVCAVFPGRDYVLQYASLMRHLAWDLKSTAMKKFHIVRYPHVEATLCGWTQLDDKFVKPGDIIVLGYVDELKSFLINNPKFKHSSEIKNNYCVSTRFQVGDTSKCVNLLGVTYSYWGSIAEVLADEFCRLKVSEIIYFAKVGTLTSPEDIYTKIFFGREYFVVDYNRVRHRINSLRNYVAEQHQADLHGRHASVPTVLEEDYFQRGLLTELKIETIDNEVAKIARALQTNNSLASHQVKYSPIHFATDYIRQVEERLIKTHSDLSKDHFEEQRARKGEIIRSISLNVLLPYLESA